MKHEIFNQYVERVTNLFDINKEDFFSKSKKRELVDARHLVYYLCAKRPMQITYIQKYMGEGGYIIEHSSIIHGISATEKKIVKDEDYVSVIKEIDRTVSIIDKYNPNTEETEEEDGLRSAKLRLYKVLQKFEGQQDLINSSYPLLKNMQLTTELSSKDKENTSQSFEGNPNAPETEEDGIQAEKLRRLRVRQLFKGRWDPNAPETEEDLLLVAKSQFYKMRQHSMELKARTQRLLESQKNTQKNLEVEEPSLLAEKMTEEQKEATKFAEKLGYVLNKGLALYLLYGDAPRDEWEQQIPQWVEKLPEGKPLVKS